MEHNISDKVMLQRKQSLHPSIQSMLRLIHFTFTLLEDDTAVQPLIILVIIMSLWSICSSTIEQNRLLSF